MRFLGRIFLGCFLLGLPTDLDAGGTVEPEGLAEFSLDGGWFSYNRARIVWTDEVGNGPFLGLVETPAGGGALDFLSRGQNGDLLVGQDT